MFYEQLLRVTNTFDTELIGELDFWLATLPANRTNNISASLVSSKFGISLSVAKILLKILSDEGILKKHFMGKCPECDMTIKIIKEEELHDFLENPQAFCGNCFKDVYLTIDDVYVAYTRVRKPDATEDEIAKEILKRLNIEEITENFSSADSLVNNRFDLYEAYYRPDESAYDELEQLLLALDYDYGKNTTAKGAAYEKLVLVILKLICGFSGTNSIKTFTNQFDCTIACPNSFTILTVFSYLTPYFIIECKNEKKTASNTYFHKLSSIMDGTDAKVGMVFSREHASKEARGIAYTQYLINKNIKNGKIMLSFDDNDLDLIIRKRENVLKYIDFKILELTTNAKNAEYEMFKTTNGTTIV